MKDQFDAGRLRQGFARQIVLRGPEAAGDEDELARPAAMRKASMLASRSSATVVCQPTGTPISARRRLSHWLLVSRFWPLVISLPMEMISLFIDGVSFCPISPMSPKSMGPMGLIRLIGRRNPCMETIKIILMEVAAAIVYGILHDQITARVCVEYFTIGHGPADFPS